MGIKSLSSSTPARFALGVLAFGVGGVLGIRARNNRLQRERYEAVRNDRAQANGNSDGPLPREEAHVDVTTAKSARTAKVGGDGGKVTDVQAGDSQPDSETDVTPKGTGHGYDKTAGGSAL